MNVKLERRYPKKGYTIGKLFVEDVYVCDVLEDEDRGLTSSMSLEEIIRIKIPGRTAIPKGRYEIRKTYSPKYKRMMPLICDVPGFSGIRIHSGNDEDDTEGCVLCGKNRTKGKVLDSRLWTNRVYAIMDEAWDKGDRVWINII